MPCAFAFFLKDDYWSNLWVGVTKRFLRHTVDRRAHKPGSKRTYSLRLGACTGCRGCARRLCAEERFHGTTFPRSFCITLPISANGKGEGGGNCQEENEPKDILCGHVETNVPTLKRTSWILTIITKKNELKRLKFFLGLRKKIEKNGAFSIFQGGPQQFSGMTDALLHLKGCKPRGAEQNPRGAISPLHPL